MSDFNNRKCDEYEKLFCDGFDIPDETPKKHVVPNSVYFAVEAELRNIMEQLNTARKHVEYLESVADEMRTWIAGAEMEDTDYE